MDYSRLIAKLLFDAGFFSKAAYVQRTGAVAAEDRELVNRLLLGRGYGSAVDRFDVADDEDEAA